LDLLRGTHPFLRTESNTMGEALEELKGSLKNLIAVQVNLVTTVQESITAVAKVLEALDSESLLSSTAATNAAIVNTSAAMQNATAANTKLTSQLQQQASGPTSAQTPIAMSSGPGASPAKMAVAMFPYQGEQSSDLSFNANDKITVLKEDPSGWWYGECKGNTGLFPKNFVSVVDAAGAPGGFPAVDTSGAARGSVGISPMRNNSKSPSPLAVSPTGSMPQEYRNGRKFRVLFDYDAEAEEELTIREGQIVAVLDEADGYFRGINNDGQVGKFPSIFVEATT